jgi:non-specific riboncleoside hydrolase
MTRKIIIDCDPGIDDAAALAMALFDPRLEVLAITACSGTVEAERSTQNVQALIELLDPPKHPRLGAATDPEDAAMEDGRFLHGEDGLGNIGLSPMGRQHLLASEKLIAEQIRAHFGQVTLLCLGPLTGIARAFRRDPSLVEGVDRIIMTGGALDGIGDISLCSEFNMHFDPASAAAIFRSPTTKTLVPLEITRQVAFGLDLLDKLPMKYTRVGKLLHHVLPHLYRSFRQLRASETIYLPSVVSVLTLTEPSVFQTQERYVEIEQRGDLTRGMTLLDQRGYGASRRNMEVVVGIDVESARDCILNAWKFAGQASEGV